MSTQTTRPPITMTLLETHQPTPATLTLDGLTFIGIQNNLYSITTADIFPDCVLTFKDLKA